MRFLILTNLDGKKLRVNFALVSEYAAHDTTYNGQQMLCTRIAYADDNCVDVREHVSSIDEMLSDVLRGRTT